MEKVRYGIIGIGVQGTYYNEAIFDAGIAKDAVVTAMCDVDPEKITAMREKTKNKDVTYFTDYK